MAVEHIVAELTCEACEGTGWAAQIRFSNGHVFAVRCTSDRIEERVDHVGEELRRGATSADTLRICEKYRNLYEYFASIIGEATYSSCRCPWCGGYGWTERYVQVIEEAA